MGAQASLGCSGKPFCTNNSSCTRLREEEKSFQYGDKYLLPKERQRVSGRCLGVATLRWSVETCEANPISYFAKPTIEPNIRRKVLPFCFLLNKQDRLVSALVSGKTDEDNGIRFIVDEYDSHATIEFAALNELASDVHRVMFGIKSRDSSSKSAVSFTINFSWATNEEIHIHHPSFLGSQILIIASITLSSDTLLSRLAYDPKKARHRNGSWMLENICETIPQGVNPNAWAAYIQERNSTADRAGLNSVLMDGHVLRYIRDAHVPQPRSDSSSSPSNAEGKDNYKSKSQPSSSSLSAARTIKDKFGPNLIQDFCFHVGGDEIPSAPNAFPRKGGWLLPKIPRQPLAVPMPSVTRAS